MTTGNRSHVFLRLCCLILVVSLSFAACNFSSKNDENNSDPQLTIQALQFQLTTQAQAAQITALAQTIAVPQQPQAPVQPAPPIQPVETQLVETSAPPPAPPASNEPFITLKADAPCLWLWNTDKVLDEIPAGETAKILYKTAWDTWWVAESPKGCICYVSSENIESISGDVSGLKLYPTVGYCP